MTKDGKTGAEIKAYLEKRRPESSIYIAVNTLEYLKKAAVSPLPALPSAPSPQHQTGPPDPGVESWMPTRKSAA